MKTTSGLAGLIALAGLVTVVELQSATVVTDSSFPYSIYLPDDWVRTVVSADRHTFLDTTGTMKSQLAVVKSTFSTVDYPKATDWTRAHFIAYKVSVDLSVQLALDPFGAVLYYDSSATLTQKKNLWATELYSMFHSIDTAVGSWAEYVRFTASGTTGFEIYALGDTADMSANVGNYAAILQGMEFPANTPVRYPFVASLSIYREAGAGDRTYTLTGRQSSDLLHRGAPGIRLNYTGRKVIELR